MDQQAQPIGSATDTCQHHQGGGRDRGVSQVPRPRGIPPGPKHFVCRRIDLGVLIQRLSRRKRRLQRISATLDAPHPSNTVNSLGIGIRCSELNQTSLHVGGPEGWRSTTRNIL